MWVATRGMGSGSEDLHEAAQCSTRQCSITWLLSSITLGAGQKLALAGELARKVLLRPWSARPWLGVVNGRTRPVHYPYLRCMTQNSNVKQPSTRCQAVAGLLSGV